LDGITGSIKTHPQLAYNKKGYNIRAENIKRITEQYYEPENQSKCYKAVWRYHVFPLYGISYRSYLVYVKKAEKKPEAGTNNNGHRQLDIFKDMDF
jgi:hypothetical protein